MTEKLCDKVLCEIKEGKIKPKPRWQFLLEDYFIWLFFLISLFLGALAFCATLHILFSNDWDLYLYLHTTLAGHIFASIPYVWLALLALFIGVAQYNFKHTKSGYRRETYVIIGLSVAGSLILGAFLHTLGAGEKIENAFAANVPHYEKFSFSNERKDIWSRPEIGLLGGKIIFVIDENNFELKDFDGRGWRVEENKETVERGPFEIKAGEMVKIIGLKKKDFVFWAREIRPWRNPAYFFGKIPD